MTDMSKHSLLFPRLLTFIFSVCGCSTSSLLPSITSVDVIRLKIGWISSYPQLSCPDDEGSYTDAAYWLPLVTSLPIMTALFYLIWPAQVIMEPLFALEEIGAVGKTITTPAWIIY